MSDAYGDLPDISQLTPATGKVGAPASGTYGEGAALADLQRQLPPPTAPQGQAAPGSPGMMPMPEAGGALPRSLTPGSIAPTTRPAEPLSTPLTQQMPIGETPSAQQRQLLEAWASDPNLRETTRVWAQSVLAALGEP